MGYFSCFNYLLSVFFDIFHTVFTWFQDCFQYVSKISNTLSQVTRTYCSSDSSSFCHICCRIRFHCQLFTPPTRMARQILCGYPPPEDAAATLTGSMRYHRVTFRPRCMEAVFRVLTGPWSRHVNPSYLSI